MDMLPIEGDPSFNNAVKGILFGWVHVNFNISRVTSA